METTNPNSKTSEYLEDGWRTYVEALRPRQWIKNLLVFAPLVFGKSIFREGAALRSFVAAAAFCFIASGLYVVNDWMDREQDKFHPEKRKRPIAAGLISRKGAIALVAGCWAFGALTAFKLGAAFGAFVLGYVLLLGCYSLWIKRWVILDVIAIAFGFVLRVFAGGVAVQISISHWLYLCTLLLALFLGFAKRRNELSSLRENAPGHRAILSEYSLPMLDQMLSIVASACIVAYGLYTVSPETVAYVGDDQLKFTIPIVVYGMLRYLFLIHRREKGGSPERVLLSDTPLSLTVVIFVAAVVWILY